MKRKFSILFFAISVLLLLSGCVSVVQEISIAEDGTGALRFAFGVETESYAQFEESIPEGYQLENFLAALIQDENVTEIEEDHYLSGGYTWDSITLEVADFRLLFEEERRIGPLVILFDQDDEIYTFSQIIDIEGSNLQIPGINLLDLTGANFTARLHSPQIVDTNGVQPSAGISEWDISLGELLQGGESVFLQADYSLEPYEGVYIPWEVFFPYVVIGFLALGGLSILIVIIINTRNKKEDIQKIEF